MLGECQPQAGWLSRLLKWLVHTVGRKEKHHQMTHWLWGISSALNPSLEIPCLGELGESSFYETCISLSLCCSSSLPAVVTGLKLCPMVKKALNKMWESPVTAPEELIRFDYLIWLAAKMGLKSWQRGIPRAFCSLQLSGSRLYCTGLVTQFSSLAIA